MTKLSRKLKKSTIRPLKLVLYRIHNWWQRHFGADDANRSAWYRYLNDLALRNNLFVYRPHLSWLSDPDFARLRGVQIVGIPDDRLFLLYSVTKALANVPGDIAECGVREAKSAYFVLQALVSTDSKKLHLFDSFEGLSAPTENDLDSNGETVWERGILACSEEKVRKNLAGFEARIELYKGWIPDRFPDVANEQFCLVHVDVDLFEPTRDSVEFFYPRLVPNGILIFDDYGSGFCRGARQAIDTFFADKPEHLIHLPTGQGLVIKH